MNITPDLENMANFMFDNRLSSARLYKSGRLKLRHYKTDLPHKVGTCQSIVDLQLNGTGLTKLSETTELRFKFTDPNVSFESLNEAEMIQLLAIMTASNCIPGRIIDIDAVTNNPNLIPATKVISCWPTGKFPKQYCQLFYLYGTDRYFDKVEIASLVTTKKRKAALLALTK